MDWLSNWRFHWFEIVVYQTVLYLPASLAGLSASATLPTPISAGASGL
jgi:sterol desaturase/sphingolipid hydroxylase (fatty acid hydroxylase superfamily)